MKWYTRPASIFRLDESLRAMHRPRQCYGFSCRVRVRLTLCLSDIRDSCSLPGYDMIHSLSESLHWYWINVPQIPASSLRIQFKMILRLNDQSKKKKKKLHKKTKTLSCGQIHINQMEWHFLLKMKMSFSFKTTFKSLGCGFIRLCLMNIIGAILLVFMTTWCILLSFIVLWLF